MIALGLQTVAVACFLAGAGTDWPKFLGPTADSKSPETGLLTKWGPCGPPVVWHRKLGTGYGIGAVAEGRFFQFDRVEDQARLTCLDPHSGTPLWKFQYPTEYEDLLGYNNGPRSSPVIDGRRVYIFGPEGLLQCVDARDGKLVWKVATAKKFGVVQNFFGVGSTPVVEKDLLIVMVGGSPADSQDAGRFDLDRVVGNGSGIVAFDKQTGQVKYAITDELASYSTPQLATIDGRRWCFVFARGGLVAFDPATGKVDFHYPWRARLRDSVNASTPVVAGNEVFISETYGPGSSLLRVKPGGYDVVWRDPPERNKALQCHWNTPIYHQGYLYGSSGRHSGEAELRCIEWKSGKIQWSQPGLGRASLLYVDGHFICLGEDGELRLIQATEKEYVEVARAIVRETADGPPLLKPPAWAAPILSHGLLYVRGEDRLVCLRLIAEEH
jgi:outer membrane protein assembly factor BamB